MTEDEKAAVLQFMGQAYGHTHKQDQMIVGQSQQLSPQSHLIKQQFEQVLNTPAQPKQQNAPEPVPVQEPVAAPVEQQYTPPAPVTVEQAQQELAAAASINQPGEGQVEFDFSEPSKIDKLITLAEKQTLLLKEINLKLSNLNY